MTIVAYDEEGRLNSSFTPLSAPSSIMEERRREGAERERENGSTN